MMMHACPECDKAFFFTIGEPLKVGTLTDCKKCDRYDICQDCFKKNHQNCRNGGVKLWLDDMRPSPFDWIWVETVEAAKQFLVQGNVSEASLDHDLGACPECMKGRTVEQWLEETQYTEMPNCEHFGTGLTLVKWMEETGFWPTIKPIVHSRNAKGRTAMQEIINRKYAIQVSGT